MTGNQPTVSIAGEEHRLCSHQAETGIATCAPQRDYSVPLGYLRAFVTLLVVAHHAVLAYHPVAPPPPASLVTLPRLWLAFPVVDAHRSILWALFVGFNDIFFMALMFFLSGLFVWNSLQRKGTLLFLRERLLRLGLPFVIAAAVLGPLAYFPAYLQTAAQPTLAGYWAQWRALGNWPAGPAWFLWVLLTFDCGAAALYALRSRWAAALPQWSSASLRRPWVCFVLLAAASAAAYFPMALKFHALSWTTVGPFTFQTSRIFHYTVYFLAGVLLGAQGLDRTVLEAGGMLARRWLAWSGAALSAFFLDVVMVVLALGQRISGQTSEALNASAFVLSCAASSFAFLALFSRFARTQRPWWDSLSRNAYGIYLVHYAFVSWLQLAALKLPLSGLSKGSLVILSATLLSWATAMALRRFSLMRRII